MPAAVSRTEPLSILIAPDSFKGSATAAEVASALADGWLATRPQDSVRSVPMADGGEGTVDAFEEAFPGSSRKAVTVVGPDGRPATTSWLHVPDPVPSAEGGQSVGGLGVVELASASGITLLDPLLPFDAHTFGFGQAIVAALDEGVDRLILAIGGSSSTDAGAGVLEALGARLLDVDGRPVVRGNRGLAAVATLDLSGMRPLPGGGATIVSDVTSPLAGPDGAAYVFGSQKGAGAADLSVLDGNLRTFASMVPAGSELGIVPGAGAAGGTGFGLLVWGAMIAPGAPAVGDALGVPDAVSGADVVVTGEGRFDSQSTAGKVPDYIGRLTRDRSVPLMLVAGSIEAPTDGFLAAESLSRLAGGSAKAIADPLPYLREAGSRLAATLSADAAY